MASFSTFTLRLAARNNKPLLRCISLNVNRPQSSSFIFDGIPIENKTEENAVDDVKNVSRLPLNNYKKYHGQPPDLPYKDLHKRKMLYAQFGVASGEDPRILWPTRLKLLDQEQEEKEESVPFFDRIAQIEAEKQEAENAILERRSAIAKNMSQMPKWIQEYKKKQESTQKVAKDRAVKKEALLEEARDHFGYTVQANDPKFLKMVEDKELQEKTEKKKLKKEEKLRKSELRIEKLTSKTEESKEG